MSTKYVVEVVGRVSAGHEVHSFWFGPAHGWGTTSGPIDDYSVANFTSRDHAERALKKVYGSMAEAKRHGYRIKAWDIAVIEHKNRIAAREAAKEAKEPT